MFGSIGTKSAIAHQVQVGHLFCAKRALPLKLEICEKTR
jgi:hypothetical protein